MIDARESVRVFSRRQHNSNELALLDLRHDWGDADCAGIILGMLDGPFVLAHPDRADADIVEEHFERSERPQNYNCYAHATHSLTILVGPGKTQIRGLVPRAQLRVAVVIGSDAAHGLWRFRLTPGSQKRMILGSTGMRPFAVTAYTPPAFNDRFCRRRANGDTQ